MTHKINWDEPYNQKPVYRTSWGAIAVVIAFYVIVGSLMVIVGSSLTGCGPSTQQISTMSGVELWEAHRKSPRYRLDGSFDMEIVRALRARGGISDADVAYYAAGHKSDVHPTMFACWNDTFPMRFYDWEALGYASIAEVNDAMSGIGGQLPGTTVYTSGGAFRVTRSGHSVTVRGSR